MSNLTNNTNKFISKVNHDLKSPPLDQEIICQYLYNPALGSDKFSIFILKNIDNNKFRAFKKTWDISFLPQPTILFDLEKTGIKTTELNITKDQLIKVLDTVEKIENYPLIVGDEKAIILDGVEEILKINYKHINKDYNWNASTKDLKIIQPIIDVILLLAKN